jgi:putative Holliday junction resolvase
VIEERDERCLSARIAAIVQEQSVGRVVVGLPRPLSGGTNRQLEKVEAFSASLAAALQVPVTLWDERFTSKLAERSFAATPEALDSRTGRRSRRPRSAAKAGEASGSRDAVAACHLLQSYLDAQTDRVGDGSVAGGAAR